MVFVFEIVFGTNVWSNAGRFLVAPSRFDALMTPAGGGFSLRELTQDLKLVQTLESRLLPTNEYVYFCCFSGACARAVSSDCGGRARPTLPWQSSRPTIEVTISGQMLANLVLSRVLLSMLRFWFSQGSPH